MKIVKLGMTIEDQTALEHAQALAAQLKATQDYNVMMGYIEDPSESEDEEDE